MAGLRQVLCRLVLYSLFTVASCRIRPEDRDALWRLYELTSGSTWRMRGGWSADGDPCLMSSRWAGVGCTDPCKRWHDGDDCALGRVTALSLDQNGLSGDISNWTALGQLHNLTILDLTGNSLLGTLPTEIGRIQNLESLQFPNNKLSGTLPTELGAINSNGAFVLEEIGANSNSISGTIPSSLGLLTGLTSLNFKSNQLSGVLPSSLATLGKLSVLYAQDNPGLGGSLPDLSGLTRLHYIDVSRARLSGTMPSSIGDLTMLQRLHLDENSLSGSLPNELTNCSQLHSLRLGSNRFTGELPAEIGKLYSLRLLDVYNNSMIGDVPRCRANARAVPTQHFTFNRPCLLSPQRSTLFLRCSQLHPRSAESARALLGQRALAAAPEALLWRTSTQYGPVQLPHYS